MTIAIDINDVIRDFTRQFIKYYQKVINPSFEIEYDDVNDFEFTNIFPFLDENGNARTSCCSECRGHWSTAAAADRRGQLRRRYRP